MVGTIWPGANGASARSGRVSGALLSVLAMVLLIFGVIILVGVVHDQRVQWACLRVLWFGLLALWLAAIIRFARKTTGTPYARVVREARLVWAILLALLAVSILPGGVEAWLTTAARLFVGEPGARRIGEVGFSAVFSTAMGLFWFHFIRCGYVMRAASMCSPKADAGEIERRVGELRDKPPGAKLRVLLATAFALFFVGGGLYASWDWARSMTRSDEYFRKLDEHWFRESVQWGFPQALAPYLQRGVNVNAADKNGYTALHLAADEGHANVAEFLLANGADVNATSKNGYTPLHLAVLEGHRGVVDVLLAHGADVNPRDWESKTPLRLALDRGYDEIAQLLREHGGTE